MDILLSIILAVVGSLLIFFLTLYIIKGYLKASTKIESANGISSLEEIELGGLYQWIFIRGEDISNPVLIFLHGGPGEPVMAMSASRKIDKKLVKHFTVVHWDQRGAGKSYSPDISVDSMTLDRLVEDCNELIDYLCAKLDKKKVFIVGHSGGTIIGLRIAYSYPEKLHAYVGVSQIINDYEQHRIIHSFVLEQARRTGDTKIESAIAAIGPPPYEKPKPSLDLARHVGRYGGFMHRFSAKQMLSFVMNYLTSPEYSISEGIRTIRGKGFEFTQNAVWDEMVKINFTNEIQKIQIPIYFFVGKYDMITPSILVEEYYEQLDDEQGKTLIVFENSAHFLMMEEKEKYQDYLIDVVMKECQEDDPNHPR
jgi:pimeloyl-ACP methyl ester carboxylesterase